MYQVLIMSCFCYNFLILSVFFYQRVLFEKKNFNVNEMKKQDLFLAHIPNVEIQNFNAYFGNWCCVSALSQHSIASGWSAAPDMTDYIMPENKCQQGW